MYLRTLAVLAILTVSAGAAAQAQNSAPTGTSSTNAPTTMNPAGTDQSRSSVGGPPVVNTPAADGKETERPVGAAPDAPLIQPAEKAAKQKNAP